MSNKVRVTFECDVVEVAFKKKFEELDTIISEENIKKALSALIDDCLSSREEILVNYADANANRHVVNTKNFKIVNVEIITEEKEDSIFNRLKTLVSEHLGVNRDKITLGSMFTDDLGADSLDKIELVMAVEEEFGIVIKDDEDERISTIKDAVDFIEAKLAEPEVKPITLKKERSDVPGRFIIIDESKDIIVGYIRKVSIKPLNWRLTANINNKKYIIGKPSASACFFELENKLK